MGKTVPVAYFLAREASDDIIDGLKAIGLHRVDVLVTDEGGCYGPTAVYLKAKHILCVYHFQRNSVDKCGGMLKDEKDAFIRDINAVLYHHFNDDEDLMIKITEMQEKYRKDAHTIAFIDKICSLRFQVCVTHTRKLFTSSHVSSQRSESFNSTVKEKGRLKQQMRGFSIYKLMLHLESVRDALIEEIVQEIMKV